MPAPSSWLERRDPLLLRSRWLRRATARPERLARGARLYGRTPVLRGLAAPAAWWLGRGPVVVLGGLGEGLRLRASDVPPTQAQAGVIVRGTSEIPVQEALRRTLPPGGVLWDVGANVGFLSLLGARLAGPEGQVHAFEPVPSFAAAVRANAALNGFGEGRVVVHEVAAASRSGRGRLLEVGEAGWSHLDDRGEHAGAVAAHDVATAALDELLAEGVLAPPHVVKLDVEGSEVDALRGMTRTLAEHRPALVVELHETNAELAAFLEAHGYAAENLDGPEPLRDARGDVHVLARPRA